MAIGRRCWAHHFEQRGRLLGGTQPATQEYIQVEAARCGVRSAASKMDAEESEARDLNLSKFLLRESDWECF